ncbi:MAG: ATP-dependent DNA helicase RecG [Bacteroidetes bacterium]|nr:MAG: ATP-dependent DNA helicase RecG [Bacteroidota bacterium]
MNAFLQTPIEFLKGVGPQRAELLRKELGIYSYHDLLSHFPFRYVDRSVYLPIAMAARELQAPVQIRGRLTSLEISGKGRHQRLSGRLQDASGIIELLWFQGIKWIRPSLKLNVEYQVYGKIKMYGNKCTIAHPEIQEMEQTDPNKGLKPVYSSTEKLGSKGLHSRGIEKLLTALIPQIERKIPENLPLDLIRDLNLLSREEALRQIHYPKNQELINRASYRLKFEELFFLQLELLLRKQVSLKKNEGFVFDEVGALFMQFYEEHLPFELTSAQKRVIREIRADCKQGFHMNRLVQGDVGSGKTIVALLCMLIAVGNGYQAALMAPTEILAQQHFESLSELSQGLPIEIRKLSGSSKSAERKEILSDLAEGKLQILVGTHALIEDRVRFQNLGLVVIDEQHRFGVAQRAKLWKKNKRPPHVLVMTATPIPRTLAMTLYGDLDISVIDELPPGRKPITTKHFFEKDRLSVFGFMKREIAKGRQVYVVYPLIAESETLDYNNLQEGFEAISRSFPLPEYQVSIVHGQMKSEVKEFEMKRFVEGQTHIMVATTVIEVGVNVPNASVMVIESAERFGLSQLHQLRGRVGRGAEQSYCMLMTGNKLSKESKKRLETMVKTQDGFEIAEVDLELRGPGDLMGTQQSGDLDLKIANLATDGPLVALARQKARLILEDDPELIQEKNLFLREHLAQQLKGKPNWSKIS